MIPNFSYVTLKRKGLVKIKLFAPIICLTLLGGCALGPNYQRQSGLVPDEYRALPTQAQPTATSDTLFADMPWWEVFQDPQLQVLIRTALENNQDLKIATARVEEARAILGITSANLFPQVGASGVAARERTPNNLRSLVLPPSETLPQGKLTPRHNNAFSSLLNLSYEVDLWGRVRRLREANQAELLATSEARQTVVSTLVTEVARSYFNLLELDREIELTTSTLHARQKTLALIKLRRKHGAAAGLEVNRYRAECSAAQANLAVLRKMGFQAENALSTLLGQAPADVRRGIHFREQPAIPEALAGLPTELLDRRPDLRGAEQRLIAATAHIGVAKAAFFPRIALTAENGYRSRELEDLLKYNNHGWMIAGAATQPIFQGGRNWFNYKATQARREQALQNYRKTVLQALREVSDALIAKEQSAIEHHQRDKQVQALQDAVHLCDLRYNNGKSNYLELLNAEQQLFMAQILLERTRLNELLSSVLLYKALGGGVEAPGTVRLASREPDPHTKSRD
jgi:outer membrane protein, multidrug efflux system